MVYGAVDVTMVVVVDSTCSIVEDGAIDALDVIDVPGVLHCDIALSMTNAVAVVAVVVVVAVVAYPSHCSLH